MSQLQFQQITFTKADAGGSARQVTGSDGISRNSNILGSDKNTDYRIYRYPLDIGAYDKGHYMVIHINEQREARTGSDLSVAGNDKPTVLQNRDRIGYYGAGTAIQSAFDGALKIATGAVNAVTPDAGTDASSTVESAGASLQQFLLNNGGPVVDALVGLGKGFTEEFSSIVGQVQTKEFATDFTRTIKRTKDTIVLYMPDTMAFTYNQGYNELNVGSDARLLSAIGAGLSSFQGAPNADLGGQAAAKALSPFLLQYLSEQNDLGRVAFAAIEGVVLNPMIELIYSTPTLRNFQFAFMFYPKNEKEAKEINRILDRLRFHQAPSVRGQGASQGNIAGSVTGAFLLPPSEFDIEFYYNGSINPNIDKISTCVLESIDIDYAPNGFSAYEVDGQTNPKSGGTGMPVAISLRLSFKETEYMTKAHYGSEGQNEQGNYNINTTVPYDAFEESQLAGLSISQNLSGELDSDLPQQVPNG